MVRSVAVVATEQITTILTNQTLVRIRVSLMFHLNARSDLCELSIDTDSSRGRIPLLCNLFIIKITSQRRINLCTSSKVFPRHFIQTRSHNASLPQFILPAKTRFIKAKYARFTVVTKAISTLHASSAASSSSRSFKRHSVDTITTCKVCRWERRL